MICKYCGIAFEKNSNSHVYCSRKCQEKAYSYTRSRIDKENQVRQSMNERQATNKLNKIMDECGKRGISYSEWKKEQTLAKVPRIEV